MPTELYLPPERLGRWLDNFTARHGTTGLGVEGGALVGVAEDDSRFRATPPFGRSLTDPLPAALVSLCEPPAIWGILLVRKGGFAIARLDGADLVEHKIGQRHVQGRTKAGGQSQQRFARRRANQARQAYEAAADHAARILGGHGALTVVTGGDHVAVDAVLADPRLASLDAATRFLSVPDPRRSVLDDAIRDACAVALAITNA